MDAICTYVRREKVGESVAGALEGESAHQEDEEHQVGESCREVHDLWWCVVVVEVEEVILSFFNYNSKNGIRNWVL